MEGIVIKSIDYKEKSKLVYLYTPMGMKSVKALDVSKAKLGFVTTLNVVEFQTSKSKLPTVLEYSIKKSFYAYYENLKIMQVIFPILDVIEHLEEDAPHHRIYPFVLECLSLLEKVDSSYVLSLFLMKMLAVFGVRPNLDQCVFCGRTAIVNFSISSGGALCDHCATYNENNFLLYQWVKDLYYKKDYLNPLKNASYETILEAIYSYYAIHVHLKLKDYRL